MSEITLQEYQQLVQQQGQALLDVVQSVALGDLDVQVQIPEGVEILSDLAVGLEMMIDDLREIMAEQEKARQEVEQARQQLQTALEEVLEIQRRYLRREWQDYTQPAGAVTGYIRSEEGSGPAADAWLPIMAKAVQEADTIQSQEDGEAALAVPIKVYGEVIGVIGFDRRDGRPWEGEQIAAVEAIVEQVGWALESQRLFDQEQQAYRQMDLRVRELTCLSDIGRKIDQTPPVAEFLTWVAERIPAAMQFPELAMAAIRYDDDIYGDAQAFDSPWQIVQSFRVGERAGQVCIAYRQEQDFLDEESALLGDITRRVGGYLENIRLLEETRTALNETETLFRIARGLAQAQNQQEMFELVLTEYLSALGLPQGGVMTLDPSGEYGILHALMQEGRLVESGIRFPVANNPPTVRALATREPVVIRDAYTDELTAPVRDLVDQLGYRSLLLVPIIVRGEAIGLLGADSVGEIHEFSEGEINLVRAVADQLGIAMEHQRLLEETQAALSETQALYRAGERIARAATVEEVAEVIVREAGRLGIPVSRFILAEPWGGPRPVTFRVIAAWDEGERAAQVNPSGTMLPAEAIPFFTDMLLARQAASYIYTLDGPELPPIIRQFLTAAEMKAVHYMPVYLADRPVGFIALAQTEPEGFDERTISHLQTLLIQVATAIENRRLLSEAQIRAERERLLREITARLRSFTDPDAVARVAVRELGMALERPVFIRLVAPQATPPPAVAAGGSNGADSAAEQPGPISLADVGGAQAEGGM